MRKPLTPEQYPLVLPLFKALDFNLVIRSVAAGNTPAWVFVDRPASPSLALIWDRQDALLLAGSNQDLAALASLRNLLHSLILPDARARWIPEMALFSTAEWQPMLPMLLSGLAAQPAGRYSYRFPPGDPPALPPVPAGFRLLRLDANLLAESIQDLDQARGWIDSFWHTPEVFLRDGFGYCLIHEDPRQVAAWSLTVFVADQACELGVATMPEYRGRGLATIAATACIRHALEEDRQVHWHCWADNQPSAAIAEKLGFQRERDYQVIRFKTGLAET